jgi:hypothetical protein
MMRVDHYFLKVICRAVQLYGSETRSSYDLEQVSFSQLLWRRTTGLQAC